LLPLLIGAVLLCACGSDDDGKADTKDPGAKDASAADVAADAATADAADPVDSGVSQDATGDGGTTDAADTTDTTIADTASADGGGIQDSGPGDTGATDSGPSQDSGAVDIAKPTTCTAAQWSACDDGIACTTEHCHPQQGCLSLHTDGCSTCPRFSAVQAFGSDLEWAYRVVALKSGSWLGIGATDDQGTLVARSATGKLEWTLKFGAGVGTGFEGVSLRDDGLMWLVGTRKVGAKPKLGWIVRMKQDGKAGLEWAEVDDKHDITLSDAIAGAKSGVVAIGTRAAVAGGKTEGLVLWRDLDGKPTGIQETKLAVGANTNLRAAWRHSTDGFLVCGAAGGVLVGRVSDTGGVVHKVHSGAGIGSVCRDITYTDKGKIVLVSADDKGAAALHVVNETLALANTWPYAADKLQWASVVAPLKGGDVVVAGRAKTAAAPVGALARIDPATGGIKWQRTYGGLDSEFNDVVQGADGGFAVAGAVMLGSAYRGWLLRVGADGSLKCP